MPGAILVDRPRNRRRKVTSAFPPRSRTAVADGARDGCAWSSSVTNFARPGVLPLARERPPSVASCSSTLHAMYSNISIAYARMAFRLAVGAFRSDGQPRHGRHRIFSCAAIGCLARWSRLIAHQSQGSSSSTCRAKEIEATFVDTHAPLRPHLGRSRVAFAIDIDKFALARSRHHRSWARDRQT